LITSPHNEKLKLIRKLHDRKHRSREGLFVAEGEDLVAAAARAGVEPEVMLVAGEDVEPRLLDAVSTLGSGTRAIGVYRQRWSEPVGPVCVYLHEVGDPGNVGAVIRTAHALVEGAVALGPGCADPYSPNAVRATMGSIFAQPVARAELGATPAPRVGLSSDVLARCDEEVTIPLREGGPESLNVGAAAAIALHGIGISSPRPTRCE
jgi:RNA methyltransferase, TrmH family